jgi:hypothetical protein
MLTSLIAAAAITAPAAPAPDRWWKGNLHTHTLWSDGDDYPEMVVDWYHSRGYNFLALSDHNILSKGQRWFDLSGKRGTGQVLVDYIDRFGDKWVVTRVYEGKVQVRLKSLAEFRKLFEKKNQFLMIQSEEITDSHAGKPVHLIATNIQDYEPPRHGGSVLETMQNNVDAVNQQREKLGVPMFPHIAHPNFGWGVTAEELMQLKGEKFFEVYNGHPAVRNYGDSNHASLERMWDIILTKRLAEMDEEVMYGVAVDDAHHYHAMDTPMSNPGRAWVMVRASNLTAASVVEAMEAGEFYGSTGVVLSDVRATRSSLSVVIDAEEGVEYETAFIGTRKGYDPSSEPLTSTDGTPLAVTRKYSDEIGEVLATVKGTKASYRFKGDEIYVRARVVSTKAKTNPYREGETETAWVQPVVR